MFVTGSEDQIVGPPPKISSRELTDWVFGYTATGGDEIPNISSRPPDRIDAGYTKF